MMSRMMLLAGVFLLLNGCAESSAGAPTDDPNAGTTLTTEEVPAGETDEPVVVPDPEPAALSPDEPSTELSDYPTSLELEAEAEKTVSPENLEAELDRLEAEIIGFPG